MSMAYQVSSSSRLFAVQVKNDLKIEEVESNIDSLAASSHKAATSPKIRWLGDGNCVLGKIPLPRRPPFSTSGGLVSLYHPFPISASQPFSKYENILKDMRRDPA